MFAIIFLLAFLLEMCPCSKIVLDTLKDTQGYNSSVTVFCFEILVIEKG